MDTFLDNLSDDNRNILTEAKLAAESLTGDVSANSTPVDNEDYLIPNQIVIHSPSGSQLRIWAFVDEFETNGAYKV